MTSKLKKLKDLNRKLTVNVETKKYDEKYQAKLNKIKSTVKLDGFRKGKVPNDVLIQKYGPSIHYEVLNEVIQETYPLEIAEKEIKPASSPKISIDSEDPKKGIVYSAEFEVFPKFKPKLSRRLYQFAIARDSDVIFSSLFKGSKFRVNKSPVIASFIRKHMAIVTIYFKAIIYLTCLFLSHKCWV